MDKIIGSADINEQKQKLTLGISGDVVRRAKAAGLNISAITEELLKAITYEPNDGNTGDDVVRAYEALFAAMSHLIIDYDIAVEVGVKRYRDITDNSNNIWKEYKILLTTQGMIGVNANPNLASSDWHDATVSQVLHSLYEPKKILQNLILALTKAAEENKEKIKELEFALRLVKALSDEDENKIEINRES